MSRAKCLVCREVIESKHRHDFVSCKCRQASDKKAAEFTMALNKLLSKGLLLSHHTVACAFEEVMGTGISLDGGDDYIRIQGNNYALLSSEEEGPGE